MSPPLEGEDCHGSSRCFPYATSRRGLGLSTVAPGAKLCRRHHPDGVGHFVEQSLRVTEIGRLETLGEPVVQVADDLSRAACAVLTCQQPTETRGGSHLP